MPIFTCDICYKKFFSFHTSLHCCTCNININISGNHCCICGESNSGIYHHCLICHDDYPYYDNHKCKKK